MDSGGRRVWLLALDGSAASDNAARYVVRAAKSYGVDVLRLVNARLPEVEADGKREAVRASHALEDAQRTTAKARAVLERAGLGFFGLDAPVGDDPASLIVAEAERWNASEIVMGTRGVGRLQSVTLGSVAYKVLHLTRRAVTLVPDRARPGGAGGGDLRTILLSVDGSSAADRATQFVARQYAGVAKIRVVLLNVQPQIVSGNVKSFVSRRDIEGYVQEQAQAAMRASARILDKAGIAFERRVAQGPIAEAIMRGAAEGGCGRIVLGSRGRGQAKSVLLGSVAYGVVHHATVPVTVVERTLPAPVLLSAAS